LDMNGVRQFYRGIVGRYPALASRIVLRDETETHTS